jgi:hypothetical protein
MKSVIFGAVVALGLATPSMAEVFAVSVPQPVQTYTVCQHGAKLLINDRAIPVSRGGQTIAYNGNQAVISRSPDVFIQSERIVRNAYTSLSASGNCGPF